MLRNVALVWVGLLSLGAGSASAKSDPISSQDAIEQAESALDNGRVGEAQKISEKLQRTHGLSKDLVARADVVQARTNLMLGQYANSEKIFARLHKKAPADAKLSEWYARALEGDGKNDAALDMFKQVLVKQELSEGDSYWVLAQLERQAGDKKDALVHAETALKKPIMIQSDELDSAIKTFISDLRADANAK